MVKATGATKRKRRKDKDDDELAAQIAEVAEVSKYIREASGERIREKGELYLRQGAVIAGLAPAEEKISTSAVLNVPTETKPEGTGADARVAENEKTGIAKKPDGSAEVETPPEEGKISTTAVLIPEPVDEETEVAGTPGAEEEEKISAPGVLNLETGVQEKEVFESEETERALEKISTPDVLNALLGIPGISTPGALNMLLNIPGISTPGALNKISTPGALNMLLNIPGISTPGALNRKKISTPGALNRFGISTPGALNRHPIKVVFEHEPLLKFINGTINILLTPDIDSRSKIFLIIVLHKSVFGNKKTVKVKGNDILKALGIHKKNQKKIPEEIEKAGLATVQVRKKAGTEVTFNEEIFKPNHKNGSKEGAVDRLIDIYNIYSLSIYPEGNNEEKIEEKKSIPLREIGKYVSVLSLHLAGFPLRSVTGSLIEAIRGKDPELVTAFWIYAKNNSDKIKSPGAYLIKVLDNNDTGNLSGEIMESAKACVRAAQVIAREAYDEPELSFLRALAQKLSVPGRWDREDRKSLTARLRVAGRELVKECEKALGNLSKGSKGERN